MSTKKEKKEVKRIMVMEAIADAVASGREIIPADVIKAVWPDRDYRSAWVAMRRLIKGTAKTIDIDVVHRMADYLGVTVDYLFGRNIAEK